MNSTGRIHNLLQRQLHQSFGPSFKIPQQWQIFIDSVNQSYYEAEAERETMKRALERSSQELLQSNSELWAVIQAFPDVFFWLDTEGHILDYKAGTTTDLSLSPDYLYGKRIQDVSQGRASVKFDQAIHQVLTDKTVVNVEYSLFLHGMKCYYEARLLPLLDTQIFMIIRNITELKQTEQKLRQTVFELQAIFHALPDLYFLLAAGRYLQGPESRTGRCFFPDTSESE